MNKWFSFLCVLCLFDEVEELASDFFEKTLPKWESSVLVHKEGSVVESPTDKSWEYKYSREGISCWLEEDSGRQLLFVSNEFYSFGLSKPERQERWNLIGVNNLVTGEVSVPMVRDALSARAVIESWPYEIGANGMDRLPITEIATKREFKIVNAFKTVFDKVEAVEYEFEYNISPKSGRFWVSSESNTLLGYECKHEINSPMTNYGEFKNFVTYRDTLVPSKIITYQKGKDGEVLGRTELELRYTLLGNDSSEFYLSHYGFPEPPWAQRTGWFSWWWLAGVLGVIFVGLVYRFMSQRR